MSNHIGKSGTKTRPKARYGAGALVNCTVASPAMRKTIAVAGNGSKRRKGSVVAGVSILAHVVKVWLSHTRFLPCILYTLQRPCAR